MATRSARMAEAATGLGVLAHTASAPVRASVRWGWCADHDEADDGERPIEADLVRAHLFRLQWANGGERAKESRDNEKEK